MLKKHYEAYGWFVSETTMYDFAKIEAAIAEAKAQPAQAIILESIIGKRARVLKAVPSPTNTRLEKPTPLKQKKILGSILKKFFYVEHEAYQYFEKRQKDFSQSYAEWETLLHEYQRTFPKEKYDELKNLFTTVK